MSARLIVFPLAIAAKAQIMSSYEKIVVNRRTSITVSSKNPPLFRDAAWRVFGDRHLMFRFLSERLRKTGKMSNMFHILFPLLCDNFLTGNSLCYIITKEQDGTEGFELDSLDLRIECIIIHYGFT